jgi:hypothetical protein
MLIEGLSNTGPWCRGGEVGYDGMEILRDSAACRRTRGAAQGGGAERYHNKHPFHVLMNSGGLSRASCRPGR